ATSLFTLAPASRAPYGRRTRSAPPTLDPGTRLEAIGSHQGDSRRAATTTTPVKSYTRHSPCPGAARNGRIAVARPPTPVQRRLRTSNPTLARGRGGGYGAVRGGRRVGRGCSRS